MELLAQIGTQFLGQFLRPRREDVHILGHARLINISVDRLGAEQDRVVVAAQEFQHRVLNRRQRKRLTHGELPEG